MAIKKNDKTHILRIDTHIKINTNNTLQTTRRRIVSGMDGVISGESLVAAVAMIQ